ncbi:MAG TPA: hypothetical protein VG916_01150 [Gemmatimonadaceae bacterium]|nr:hypothetical protein [Gemmatimonadaceae bacterium]
MTGADPRIAARATAARLVAIGVALGLAGLALFAALHSIVVRPIWSQVAVGIPFVVAIGLAMSWSYHEFVKAAPARLCATGGLRFGALMWLSALPATALANIERVRTHASLPAWFDYVSLVLSLVGGALALWSVTRSRRAAVAGAIAAATLLAAGGGPLPVIRNGRVVELWFGLFVLEAAGGVILAQMYRRWAAPPERSQAR